MSNKLVSVFLFVILFAVSGQIFAQTLKLPYKDVGACPFECCTYRDWFARKPMAVFKTMNSGSPIAFKLKKGEKVRGITGVVITSVAGKVKALKDQPFDNLKIKIKKGDILSILTYEGEGFYLYWFKGKFFQESTGNELVKTLSEPKSVWWVKIKNRKGQIGWAISDGNFDNQDQCG